MEMEIKGLTRQLGTFAASQKRADIPAECVKGALIGIADCIGVMVAGANEPAPQAVAALVADAGSGDIAPAFPSGRKLSPADAALVNGVAAHVLDYDDVALAGHPSAVLVPAILAEAWALGRSGKDAISAYVVGYETWALLDELEPGSLHELGFHPTAVLGTVAAAAACAHLHGLDAEKSAHAIAVSASLAAGLVANFGTMTKSLHAGRTAQSGVLAARLAKGGYTASLDVFEHRTGFMRAHSPSGHPDLDPRDYALGTHWRLPVSGVHIKRYPICYATHRSIDAMLDLVAAHNIVPDSVQEIRVHTGQTQLLMLRNHFPTTGLEAKFSMEFAMASALVAHRVGLSELSDDFVGRADVREAMKRVQCTTTTEMVKGWDQPFAPADQVTVVLKSGETLTSEPVERPKGSWQRQMTSDELRQKFVDCAQPRLGQANTAQLFEQLLSLDSVASVRSLPLITG
jgi:2-methylcitrate dehydratase PrpD